MKKTVVIMLMLMLVSGCIDPIEPDTRDLLLLGLGQHQVLMTGSLIWYQTGDMSEADQGWVTQLDAVEYLILTAWYSSEKAAGNGELEAAYNAMKAARVAWLNR